MLVHPSVMICGNVQIGAGTVVIAGAVVCDSRIRKECILIHVLLLIMIAIWKIIYIFLSGHMWLDV